MSAYQVYKVAGFVSWPLYRFFPGAYFWLYSIYKRRTDGYKLNLLARFIKPHDVVLDIGAHMGFYAKSLAELVGPAGRVLAFEPDVKNFEYLQRKSRVFPQIEPHRAAVAAFSGSGQLFRSRFLNVDHRMYGQRTKAEAVETVSVDDFVSRRKVVPNFIKMDIQGYEGEALSGMKRTLAAYHPGIVTEFWPYGLRAAGSQPEDFLNTLRGLGYKIFLADEKREQLLPFELSAVPQGEGDYYDLLCHV